MRSERSVFGSIFALRDPTTLCRANGNTPALFSYEHQLKTSAGDTALLFVHIFKAAGSSVRTPPPVPRKFAQFVFENSRPCVHPAVTRTSLTFQHTMDRPTRVTARYGRISGRVLGACVGQRRPEFPPRVSNNRAVSAALQHAVYRLWKQSTRIIPRRERKKRTGSSFLDLCISTGAHRACPRDCVLHFFFPCGPFPPKKPL